MPRIIIIVFFGGRAFDSVIAAQLYCTKLAKTWPINVVGEIANVSQLLQPNLQDSKRVARHQKLRPEQSLGSFYPLFYIQKEALYASFFICCLKGIPDNSQIRSIEKRKGLPSVAGYDLAFLTKRVQKESKLRGLVAVSIKTGVVGFTHFKCHHDKSIMGLPGPNGGS